MTCLVVSALFFSPFAWRVGIALTGIVAFTFVVVLFAALAVASEAERQMERERDEAFEVAPVAIAGLADELNVEVN